MTAPMPEHGTTARYGRGCREECCRRAETLRKKRHTLVGRVTVDPAPVVAHIRSLVADGASYRSIADASGCGIDTLKRAVNGSHGRIRATTAARILAVGSAPEREIPVDALGSVRRVQALMAVGHALITIEGAAGSNHRTVSALAAGTARLVWGRTADGIAHAYEHLSAVPGQSVRSLRRAEREGWPPPFAWDNIDDPDEQPDGWQRKDRMRSADIVEDAEFIVRTTGVGLDLAAERLGISRNYLDKARERTAARQRQAA